jgi:hypothetical protein
MRRGSIWRRMKRDGDGLLVLPNFDEGMRLE